MKRRNVDSAKLRRTIKRNRISDGLCSSALVYIKFLLVWAFVMMGDFMLEFRFEFLWPFWLLLRSVYDSFRYQGVAFSVFFVCVAITSDTVCFLFIPIQWLFFLASTYVWVQYVWHTDRGVCLPTVCLWCLFIYIEAAVRLKELKNIPFTLDLCRPFAAHCIGYPVVTLGFGVKSYVGYKYKLRKQRDVAKENEFYMQLLQEALPAEQRIEEGCQKSLSFGSAEDLISNGALLVPTNASSLPSQILSSSTTTNSSYHQQMVTSPSLSSLSKRTLNNNHRSSRTDSPPHSLNHHRNSDVQLMNGGGPMAVSSRSSQPGSEPSRWGLFNFLFSTGSPFGPNDSMTYQQEAQRRQTKLNSNGNAADFSKDYDTDDTDSSDASDVEEDLSKSGSFGDSIMKRLTNWTLSGSNTSNSSSLMPNGESPGGTESTVVSPIPPAVTSVGPTPTAQKSFVYPSSKSCRGREGRRRGAGQISALPASQLVVDSPSGVSYDTVTHNGGRGHSHRSSSTKDHPANNSANVCPTAASERGNAKDEKVQNKDLALSLEYDIEKLRNDLRVSRQTEADLKQQLQGLTQGDKSVKNELQQLRQNNEQLQTKLHNLVKARQQDKLTAAALEKKLADEQKLRSQLETSLQQERKLKKAEEAAAARAMAVASAVPTVKPGECTEACRNRRRELELELKNLKRDYRQREDILRQLEGELHSLRQYKESNDTEILMSALNAMQEKNRHLENSLSAETRIKLDLFSALGEAKRQLDIVQNQLMKKEAELEEMRQQMLNGCRALTPLTPPPTQQMGLGFDNRKQSAYGIRPFIHPMQGVMFDDSTSSLSDYSMSTVGLLKLMFVAKKKEDSMAEGQADIALIGLAVMGQNLILNMNDHGFVVCAYNRTVSKVDEFLNKEAKGTKIIGAKSLEEMVSKLKSPRRVMMLVKAGSAVDEFIDKLIPLLSKGDIIIDGGNSEYHDTRRRFESLKTKGIHFVGSGVSGGEDGARYGPSLMPGGAIEAWPHIKPIFQSISAKVGTEPCCDWVGSDGAGHYVKMVHNGIEYGDMQLICEAYHLLRDGLQMSHDDMAKVFDEWNKTELDSFLIDITANILKFKDASGETLLPKIRDSAGQKGTGKWTAISALDSGIPVTLIGEAVFARCLSALKDDRIAASKVLPKPQPRTDLIRGNGAFVEHVRKALYASKIVSYTQGFMLLQQAARDFNWKLNYGSIALMWRGGCIIRSAFLGKIKEAFDKQPDLKNLLLDDFFKSAIADAQDSWRCAISTAVLMGIPTPAFSTALAFYDGYRTECLPANLLQAQRDYFGAHTYELLSAPGKYVHSDWTGHGGRVASSTYLA